MGKGRIGAMTASNTEGCGQGSKRLIAIKLLHTAIWMFMVFCILAIPVAAFLDRFRWASMLSAPVLLECLVLAVNRCRCPLTGWAEQYTENREPDFDIYLPVWLARYTKELFGSLFVLNLVVSIWFWVRFADNMRHIR